MAKNDRSTDSALPSSQKIKRPQALRKLADVIRYDSTIIFPPKGKTSSDHVTMHHDKGKSFWVLSAEGREAFVEQIHAIGLYATNHPHLEKLKKEHDGVKLPQNPLSVSFQLVNLLVAHRHFGFTREDLEAFNVAISARSNGSISISRDVIQPLNKTPQWGLDRITDVKVDGDTVYLLHDDLQFNALHRKSESDIMSMSKAEIIAHIKALFLMIINTPDHLWDEAHTRPGSTAVTYQPKWWNRASRDQWYFDLNGLRLIPAPKHIVKLMVRHFTVAELRAVLKELTQVLSDMEDGDEDSE